MPEAISRPDLTIDPVEPPRPLNRHDREVVSIASLGGQRIFAVVRSSGIPTHHFTVIGSGICDEEIPEDLRPQARVQLIDGCTDNWRWYGQLDRPNSGFKLGDYHHPNFADSGTAHDAIRASVKAHLERVSMADSGVDYCGGTRVNDDYHY